MKELRVYIMFRFNRKTGKVLETATGVTSGLMMLHLLRFTTKTQKGVVIDRETGEVIYEYDGLTGTADRHPNYTAFDLGITREQLDAITDGRFDLEA